LGKQIDITGQRFGFWVATQIAEKGKNGQTKWLCVCECGTTKSISLNSLRTGNSTSCGCNHNPNLANERFGHLIVLELMEDITDVNRRYWKCQCDCGKTCSASTYQLTSKLVFDCGCNTQIVAHSDCKEDIDHIYSNIRDAGNSKEMKTAIANNAKIIKNNKPLMKIYKQFAPEIDVVVRQLLLTEHSL
jgi:hypothetical protein